MEGEGRYFATRSARVVGDVWSKAPDGPRCARDNELAGHWSLLTDSGGDCSAPRPLNIRHPLASWSEQLASHIKSLISSIYALCTCYERIDVEFCAKEAGRCTVVTSLVYPVGVADFIGQK